MPPRPKRLVGLDWNPALRDVRDDDNGTQFKERVEPKLEPKPKPKVEPKKEFPSDPVSPSSTEYTYEYEYGTSSECSQDDEKPIHVKSEGDCKVEHVGFMAITVDSDSDVRPESHDASPSQHVPSDALQDVAFTSHF